MNLAKDVMKKVETNLSQHKEYESFLSRAKVWIETAKQTVKECGEVPSSSSHEVLQEKLDQIQVMFADRMLEKLCKHSYSQLLTKLIRLCFQELLRERDDGQNLIHSTVNSGEKVLRNTKADGRDLINEQLKDIQSDWDRLLRKMSTAKVHLETSLLQWADYSSSYSQLQQLLSERENKLQKVCEQKVSVLSFIIEMFDSR